nr:MAG: iron-siderophore ABC transporter substrate-binding protein [Leptolyngbya sp. IPPAS B-1204]
MRHQYGLVLLFLLLIGCNQLVPQETVNQSSGTQPTRAIEHAMGNADIPVQPERVVVLDDCTLEPVLALGVKPVGAPIRNVHIPGQGNLSQIQDIGTPANLETILALKPDLILGCAYLRDMYNQVAQIAPTVIAPIETSADWQAVFWLVADALGKRNAAEQVMTNYKTRLATLRSQLGERLKSTQVSVIRVYPNHISLYAKDVFIGTILADAGLSRPPSQDQDIPAIDISKERIRDADGDVIFVWTYGSNEQLTESAQIALEKLKIDPLWQQLNAVKQGSVYLVPDYWIGAGPLSANAVIDDLFKYLIEDAVPPL